MHFSQSSTPILEFDLTCYSDLDEKYNKKRDRFSGGMVQDFTEKKHYKPNVRLEYFNGEGQAMNQKEAFRHLSHLFHGKGSGKLKTEKRKKKVDQEAVSALV